MSTQILDQHTTHNNTQRHTDTHTAHNQKKCGHPKLAQVEHPRFSTGTQARRAGTGVLGFDPPTGANLAHGARSPPAEPEDMEPWKGRGWQHVAASKVEHQHREELFTHIGRATEQQVRSQAGPGAGMTLSAAPTHHLTRIPPHLFRVVLLRRLWFPLPLSLHTCRCGCQN